MALSIRQAGRALALILLSTFALGLVACSDSEGSGGGDSAVIATISLIDKAGLHTFDESLNRDGKIPATARTTALQLQTATLLAEWPGEFKTKSKALAVVFGDFAKSLEGDSPDIKKAGEAAKKAHDAAHDFTHDVWEHLYKEAGVKTGSASHD